MKDFKQWYCVSHNNYNFNTEIVIFKLFNIVNFHEKRFVYDWWNWGSMNFSVCLSVYLHDDLSLSDSVGPH